MARQLNCVLLIDDDEPTNFLSDIVLAKASIAEKIIAFESGYAALAHLKSLEKTKPFRLPDLVFLDINMPAMNGWEFVEEFHKRYSLQDQETVIIVLTTSMNPADIEKANSFRGINGITSKPLTRKAVQEVLDNHFPG